MEGIDSNTTAPTDADVVVEDDNMSAIVSDYRAYASYISNQPGRTSAEETNSNSDYHGECGGSVAGPHGGLGGRLTDFSDDAASDLDGLIVTRRTDGSTTPELVAPASPRPSPRKLNIGGEDELALSIPLSTSLSKLDGNDDVLMLRPPPLRPPTPSPWKPRPMLSRHADFSSLVFYPRRQLPSLPLPPNITLEPFGLSPQARIDLRAHSARLPPIPRHTGQLIVAPKGFSASYYKRWDSGTPIRPREFGTLCRPFSRTEVVALRGLGRKMPLAFWVKTDSETGECYWLWHICGRRSSLRIENRNQSNTWVSQKPAVVNQRKMEFETRASGRRGGNIRTLHGGTVPVKKMGRDFLKWGTIAQKARGAGSGIQLPAGVCGQRYFSLFVGSSEEGILPNDIIPTYLSEPGRWCLCTKKGGNWQPVSSQIGMRRVGGEWPGIARIWEHVDNPFAEPVNMGDYEHFVDTSDRQHFLKTGEHQSSEDHPFTAVDQATNTGRLHQEDFGGRVYIHEGPGPETDVERNLPDTHQVELIPFRASSPELGIPTTSASLDGMGVGHSVNDLASLANMVIGLPDEADEVGMRIRGTAPVPETHLTTQVSELAYDTDATVYPNELKESDGSRDLNRRQQTRVTLEIDACPKHNTSDLNESYPDNPTIPNDPDDDGDTVIGDAKEATPSHPQQAKQRIVHIARRFHSEDRLRVYLGRKYYWCARAAESWYRL